MIKIQQNNFNIDKEIDLIIKNHDNIGAVSTFIGYVRDLNNNKSVKYIDLEVYNEMAFKELSDIRNLAKTKCNLLDCLIIHRYGRLYLSDKIVLVACFSEHRSNGLDASKLIMNYLKKDAPFWKKEYYNDGSEWLENTK